MIKKGGQFGYNTENKLISFDERNLMIINPDSLLEDIGLALSEYMDKLENDITSYKQFKNRLNKKFEVERGKREWYPKPLKIRKEEHLRE